VHLRVVTYTLGPHDFVQNEVLAAATTTLTYSEACSFSGGATAGAVGACVTAGPTASVAIPVASETLVVNSVPLLLQTSGVASLSSGTTSASSSVPAPQKTNGATPAVRVGFMFSAVLGVFLFAV
jgi:ABC-type amino acid transport system permease subunit